MTKNNSNPNIEWKKPGFGPSERLSLKIDVKKAIEYEAKNKKNVQNSYSNPRAELPLKLNKIRKKIKDSHEDEDEDENDYQDAIPLNELDNSLINALNEDEKKMLNQQAAGLEEKLLKDAGKIAAINQVEKTIKKTGIKKTTEQKIVANIAQSSKNDKDLAMRSLTKELEEEFGFKLPNNPSEKEIKKLVNGGEKILKLSKSNEKSFEGMEAEDVIEAAADEKKAAEIILKKSGRKEVKKNPKKTLDRLALSSNDRKYVEKQLAKERKEQEKF